MITRNALDRALAALDPAAELEVVGPGERQALRDRITSMPQAEPRHAPRTRWRASWAAAVAVTLVAGILALVPGLLGGERAVFAVRPLDDGRIEIDLLAAATTDADTVAEELRQHGVDVTVDPVSAPRSLVGDILGFSGSHVGGPGGEWPPAGLTLDPADDPTAMQIDPAVFRGSLEVDVAVPVAPGQRYDYVGEAFSNGGALEGVACEIGDPIRVEDLLPHLRDRGLSAHWAVISGAQRNETGGHTFTTPGEPSLVAPSSGEVITADELSPDLVRITVLPDEIVAPYITTYLDDFPCDGTQGPRRATPTG